MVVVDDLGGPLVPVVDGVAGLVVVLVVLEAFVPVVLLVLVVLVVLPEAAFGFLAVVVVLVAAFALDGVVVAVLPAPVATPAFTVVVVVGLAPLGGGTVQIMRREPSYMTAVASDPSLTVKVTQPDRHFPGSILPPSSAGFLAPGPGSCIVPSSRRRRK